MKYRLSISYRDKIEEILLHFIENCDKIDDGNELVSYAQNLLIKLEEYSQKH